MRHIRNAFLAAFVLALMSASTLLAQNPPATPAQTIRRQFTELDRKVLDMAQDFPADKYDYRPNKDVRTFREVMIHIASGADYAAKAAHDPKAKWDELDAKQYKTKDEVVAMLKKATSDAEAALNQVPDEQFAKTLRPWAGVSEHAAEHYGQLVVYYRLNGLVPPETRKGNNQ